MKRSSIVIVALGFTAVLSRGTASADATGQVDAFFGAFGTEVPIVVPPFHSMTPQVKLAYASTTANGFVGVGWSLNAGSSISRASPALGAPNYDATDVFTLDGQELVPCTTLGGTHCTKTQGYLRIVRDTAANQWYVWLKDGTKGIYTPVFNTHTQTYRWAIHTTQDTLGNQVTDNYYCDGNSSAPSECYLDNITYNGTTIQLYRELRPDVVTYAIGTSSLATARYRLKSIDVLVGGSRARAYKLTYTSSAPTGRSILQSVQQFGRDATLDGSGAITGGTSLPPMTLGYAAPSPGFGADTTWGANTLGQNAGPWTVDVNGDGKADIVYWAATTGFRVLLSTGTSFGPDSNWGTNTGTLNMGPWMADVNGDGKADVVYWAASMGYRVMLSTGTSFGPDTTWGVNTQVQSAGPWLMDVNGDGMADIVYSANGNGFHVLISTGTSFRPDTSWGTSAQAIGMGPWMADLNGDGAADILYWVNNVLPGSGITAPGYRAMLSTGTSFGPDRVWGCNTLTQVGAPFLADVNGDEKADLVYWALGGSFRVMLSTGSTFTSETTWGANAAGVGMGPWMVDINGDSRADVVYWAPNIGYRAMLSTGTSFGTDTGWGANTQGQNMGPFFADVDGNGKSDIVYWTAGAGYRVMPNSLPTADLITSVNNGIGGATQIRYTPSSAWQNTYLPMGMVFPTVASTTTTDGRGASGTMNYTFAGALWSNTDRTFLGFRKVTAVIDAAGDYTESYFHQHVGCISKPETTYFRDPTGKLFSYNTMTYTDGSSPPYTSLLTERWDYECNLNTTCRRALSQFQYDTFGNLTQSWLYGDFDVQGDERTETKGFNPNSGAYIVGLPAYENVYAGLGTAGTLMQQVLYEYDANTSYTQPPATGLLERKKAWNDQTGAYITNTSSFDAYGNLVSETDALGVTTTRTYDSTYHRFPLTSCTALGQCSTKTWDTVLGVKTAETDANGFTTTQTFDALSRPIRSTNPDGGYTELSYLNWGNPNLQHTHSTTYDGSADGLWAEKYQDGLGRVYETLQKGGITQATLFSDTSSRVWKQSLPYVSGDTVRYVVFAYDGAGRQVLSTNPDGTRSSRVYGVGTVSHYDELGHEKVVNLDIFGKTTQIREKNGASYYYTTFALDALRRVVQTTDAAGNVQSVAWDSLGRKLSQCDPDMGCWTYAYDDAGHLLAQTDAMGQTRALTYDVLGRPLSKSFPDGTQATWTYDEAGHGASVGHATTITDPSGSESMTYDLAGRVVLDTKCVDTVCNTMQSTFDILGRMTSMTYPDEEVVTYAYDTLGRLAGMPGYVNALLYDSTGKLAQSQYVNGTSSTFAYDPNRLWLVSASVANSAGALFQSSYTYDAASRVSAMGSTTHPAMNLSYGYDDLNRLTSVSGAQSQTFTYDPLGNILSNSAVGSYTYGDPAHKHAVTAAGPNNYTYDANGNLLSGAGRALTWSADNMPLTVTNASGTTTMVYDVSGQRVKKSGPEGTSYFFGAVEQRGNTLVKYYSAGPILVAMRDASGLSYYHADRLGSTRIMTDANGQVVQTQDYAPFGKDMGTTGTVANSRGFTGHETDSELGLIYMNARYYDADLGRFLSPDSIIPDGNPQSLNRYTYVNNNPISNVDPTGHKALAVSFISNWVGSTFIHAAIATLIQTAASAAIGLIKSPLLQSIASVALGAYGNISDGAGGFYMKGSGLGAAMAAIQSPISPLDPGVKQAIGYAFTAYGLIQHPKAQASPGEQSAGAPGADSEGDGGDGLNLGDGKSHLFSKSALEIVGTVYEDGASGAGHRNDGRPEGFTLDDILTAGADVLSGELGGPAGALGMHGLIIALKQSTWDWGYDSAAAGVIANDRALQKRESILHDDEFAPAYLKPDQQIMYRVGSLTLLQTGYYVGCYPDYTTQVMIARDIKALEAAAAKHPR